MEVRRREVWAVRWLRHDVPPQVFDFLARRMSRVRAGVHVVVANGDAGGVQVGMLLLDSLLKLPQHLDVAFACLLSDQAPGNP